MYKDVEKRKQASKERMQRMRQGVTLGVTKEGVTSMGVTKTEGVTALKGQGVTYPDILDKLTDKTWRKKLGMLNDAFKTSHNPHYAKEVWLGDLPLDVVFDYLECTR